MYIYIQSIVSIVHIYHIYRLYSCILVYGLDTRCSFFRLMSQSPLLRCSNWFSLAIRTPMTRRVHPPVVDKLAHHVGVQPGVQVVHLGSYSDRYVHDIPDFY